MKKKIFMTALSLFILVIAGCSSQAPIETSPESLSDSSQSQSPDGLQSESPQDSQTSYESKTVSGGEVDVTVKPINIGTDSDTWTFLIELNTHSVDLSQDMMESVTLRDGAGEEYHPLNWNGPEAGGHHRSGTLSFTRLVAEESITLIVKDIGEVPERIFQWNLK